MGKWFLWSAVSLSTETADHDRVFFFFSFSFSSQRKHIVIYDTLIEKTSEEQIEAIVGSYSNLSPRTPRYARSDEYRLPLP